jgi:hypothetical protein
VAENSCRWRNCLSHTSIRSLKINSVKITSWNPYANNYALTDDSDRNGKDTTIGTPRPYITVEVGATGTTDIINSEIAYLGYEGGYGAGRTGLRYEGGDGSIIKGNNIHDIPPLFLIISWDNRFMIEF